MSPATPSSPDTRPLSPFSRRLAAWFTRSQRSLPWRGSRDAHGVLVSEIMLQQTTAKAVVPYYERFLATLPSFEALARADESEVLALWAGLGYYRRARSLHATAKTIVDEHGGEFPQDLAGALALPGVGPYTAGAVLSLAFGKRLPAVDGNVGRVLSRHLGRPLLVTKTADRRQLEEAVLSLQSRRRPGAFNEALMELGATLCTPRSPTCATCPVSADCIGRLESRVHELPPRVVRPKMQEVDAAALFLARRGRVLLRQRPAEARIMPGLWELPGGTQDSEHARAWLESTILPELGEGEVSHELTRVRHVIGNRKITLRVHACDLTIGVMKRPDQRWTRRSEFAALGLTAATTKALRTLLPDQA